NNDFFTVERSVNAEEWQEVSTLAGAGTSLKTNRYELTDDQPIDGASYYRIKQTDYNGSISYSEIRLVKLDETQEFNVFPNPSQGQFTLEGLAEGVNYEARVLNSLGQLVNVRIDRIGNKLVTDLSSLPEGIYIMQISNGSVLQSIRLVRNR
ncbi:MAG: T9SS type A sorting domain-containing protein, partial [Cyclobacteriaceae bacterium]|nr:T9SS type A sorting domain-containing protein [Cyclobacteriaceae bacterium]